MINPAKSKNRTSINWNASGFCKTPSRRHRSREHIQVTVPLPKNKLWKHNFLLNISSWHIIILIKYRIGMWLWFWCCVSFQGRHTFSDCFNALTGRSSQIASILTGFSGKYICYQTVEQMEDHLEQMVERMRRGNLVCISV